MSNQAEKALRESLANFEAIFNASDESMLLMALDGTILALNEVAAQRLGGAPADFTGSPLRKFLGEDAGNRYRPFLAKTLNGEKVEFEDEDNGMWRTIRVHPVFGDGGNVDRVVVVSRDITSGKQADDAMARERMLLRTLIDNLPDTIYVKDVEGRKLLANPSDWKLLGFSSENDVVGKTDLEVFDPEIGTRGYNDDMEILKDGQSVINREENFIDPSGNECWLHTTKIPLFDETGKVTGLMGIGRNITDRRRSEQLLARQAEELKELIATKDKFFSIVAHDLRGPFGSFLNLTRIMVEELHDLSLSKIQQLLTNMSKSALTVYEMLENLLEWSRMQRGLTSFEPKLMVLDSKITQFLHVLNDSALDKQIFIRYKIPADLTVFADERMLESTLRNLVSNAIKFTNRGGHVTISASTGDDGAVIISVKDTGIGMSSEIMDKLFRIDVNVSRPGTAGESSSGLGLFLCKDFVERHGGTIRAESQEDNGSTFYVGLPGQQA